MVDREHFSTPNPMMMSWEKYECLQWVGLVSAWILYRGLFYNLLLNFPSVDSHVSVKATLSTEVSSTLNAWIGFLPCMYSAVFGKVTLLNEAASTLNAWIGFLSCVYSSVCGKVSLLAEAGSTLRAWIGLHSFCKIRLD